jgi:hypothetical protein
MDPRILVTKDQAQSGEELLRQLSADGLPMLGALWAKTEDDGQAYLYIVSPAADRGGFEASKRLFQSLRKLEKTWTDPFRRLDPFAIKLIGPSNRFAQDVIDFYHRWPDSTPAWRGAAPLGSEYVEGAYIYPAGMFKQQPAA